MFELRRLVVPAPAAYESSRGIGLIHKPDVHLL
jgi:hypothetical protein